MTDPTEEEPRLLVSPLIVLVALALLLPMLAVAYLNVQGPRECRERPSELK